VAVAGERWSAVVMDSRGSLTVSVVSLRRRMALRDWARIVFPDAAPVSYKPVMTDIFYKTRACRQQSLLLPPRIDDYVGADNAARAIEAYVDALDLTKLGVRHAARVAGAGQPPYDPADLLKLYIYGYLNQIRSSRRLEREAGRNIELMWLLGGLVPGYRTIAKFRAENAAPLQQINRDFVLILRKLDLVGGALVAIDGAFFDGSASKASIVTAERLAARLGKLDGKIADSACEIAAAQSEAAAYIAALDANDAAETQAAATPAAATPAAATPAAETDAASRHAALRERRAAVAADIAQLEASGQTQLSRTDPDARLLTKSGQSVAGYNVQIAVDAAHKLIVAAEAVNDGNDTGQLHAMAQAARTAMSAAQIQAVADVGYYNGETLKACEASGIEAFVPEPQRGKRLEQAGRFALDAFTYDTAADAYRCPAGEMLAAMRGGRKDATGKSRIKYASRRSVCGGCALRDKCLSAKGARRVIERWEHEAVIERHRARMAAGEEMMRQRKALAEHPFGTLKCRAGYRHFLVRGFAKVRGELGLMVLCYNFTRALNIIGLKRLVEWLGAWSAWPEFWLLTALIAALGRILSGFHRRDEKMHRPSHHPPTRRPTLRPPRQRRGIMRKKILSQPRLPPPSVLRQSG
jgi:transposase